MDDDTDLIRMGPYNAETAYSDWLVEQMRKAVEKCGIPPEWFGRMRVNGDEATPESAHPTASPRPGGE